MITLEKVNSVHIFTYRVRESETDWQHDYSGRYYPAESVERLVEAARSYLDENGHSGYCNAIKGPEHEEWYVEEDCDCESKKLKSALEPFKETK